MWLYVIRDYSGFFGGSDETAMTSAGGSLCCSEFMLITKLELGHLGVFQQTVSGIVGCLPRYPDLRKSSFH